MLGLHIANLRLATSLMISTRDQDAEVQVQRLKSRSVHVVTRHTKIRPGTLTLALLVCSYGDLLLKHGGGPLVPNSKARVYTQRVDGWTAISSDR